MTSLIESYESDIKSTDSNNDDDEVVVKEEKVKVDYSIRKICSRKNCNKPASIGVIGANNGDKVCVDCFVDAKSANVSTKGYIPNAADEIEDNSMEITVSTKSYNLTKVCLEKAKIKHLLGRFLLNYFYNSRRTKTSSATFVTLLLKPNLNWNNM